MAEAAANGEVKDSEKVGLLAKGSSSPSPDAADDGLVKKDEVGGGGKMAINMQTLGDAATGSGSGSKTEGSTPTASAVVKKATTSGAASASAAVDKKAKKIDSTKFFF